MEYFSASKKKELLLYAKRKTWLLAVDNVDKPGRHYIKRNKMVTEQILHDSS